MQFSSLICTPEDEYKKERPFSRSFKNVWFAVFMRLRCAAVFSFRILLLIVFLQRFDVEETEEDRGTQRSHKQRFPVGQAADDPEHDTDASDDRTDDDAEVEEGLL